MIEHFFKLGLHESMKILLDGELLNLKNEEFFEKDRYLLYNNNVMELFKTSVKDFDGKMAMDSISLVGTYIKYE